MEAKKSRRIESKQQRLVAFCKRRDGLFSKAQCLHNLAGAEIVVVVFSETGRPYVHGSPSFDATVERYLAGTEPISPVPVGVAVEPRVDSGRFELQDRIFPDGFSIGARPISPDSLDVAARSWISGIDQTLADSGRFELQDRIFPDGFSTGARPISPDSLDVAARSWISGIDQTLADSGRFELQDLIFPDDFSIGARNISPDSLEVAARSWISGIDQTLIDFELPDLISSDPALDDYSTGPLPDFPEPVDVSGSSCVDGTGQTLSGRFERQDLIFSDADVDRFLIGARPISPDSLDVAARSCLDGIDQTLIDFELPDLISSLPDLPEPVDVSGNSCVDGIDQTLIDFELPDLIFSDYLPELPDASGIDPIFRQKPISSGADLGDYCTRPISLGPVDFTAVKSYLEMIDQTVAGDFDLEHLVELRSEAEEVRSRVLGKRRREEDEFISPLLDFE